VRQDLYDRSQYPPYRKFNINNHSDNLSFLLYHNV